MSGFSSPEFLLIVVLALVVLGPKRLPEIANKVGGWIGQARRMTRVMRRQLEEELKVDDLKKQADELHRIASPDNTRRSATSTAADTGNGDTPADADLRAKGHIPKDDDSFSPVHEEDDLPDKPA